ncbi:MAG: tRNA pseudouridine(55) synthase TruB [Clostridia bacterium]|jgi:tRNA pseudouridine55 synthase|nr:tRNA pseudouridine(55) synthase TruB [Clostridia bacterium]
MNVDGVVLINKPEGITSHDVVGKMRKLYQTRKVGHTGTLDPLATGVMAVLIGRATKAADFVIADNKSYKAELILGITTDTLDVTGNVLSTSDDIPTEAEFMACLDKFRGVINQVPPMYSALKVDGQKLCDLARKGIEVERQARQIEIFSIEAEKKSEREYTLDVSCSKGTYIRTLCDDIGACLGCGAAMKALQRTASGNFKLESCYTIEQIQEMTPEERQSILLPTQKLFDHLPKVRLGEFFSRLASTGNEIYQKKIKTSYDIGEYVGLYDQLGEFFAVGQVKEYEQGTAIKPIKQFVI